MEFEEELAAKRRTSPALAISIERLFDTAMDLTARVLDANKCSLMVLDPSIGELVIKKARGLDDRIIDQTRVKLGSAITGRVAEHREAVLAQDAHAYPDVERSNSASYATHSFVSVPVITENLVGVLSAADKRDGGAFDGLDLLLTQEIASLMGELLGLQATIEAMQESQWPLREASAGPSLSRLGSRDEPEFSLSEQLAQARRLGIPCVVNPVELLAPDFARLVPLEVARRYRCVPIGYRRGNLTVAMENPTDSDSVKTLARITHLRVHALISSKAEIDAALNRLSELWRSPVTVDVVIRKMPGHARELKIALNRLTMGSDLGNLMRKLSECCSSQEARIRSMEGYVIVTTPRAATCSRLLRALRQIDDVYIRSVSVEIPDRGGSRDT